MGFGDAYYNVVLLHQKLYHTPFWIDQQTGKIIPNPSLAKKWKMVAWYSSNLGTILIWLLCILGLFVMHKRDKRGEDVSPADVIAHLFGLFGGTQCLVTAYTLETFPDDSTFILYQILQISNNLYRGWPSSKRIPDFPELIGYGMGFGFGFFTVLAAIGPWMKPVGPVYLVFNLLGANDVPKVIQTATASLVYGFLGLFGANSCASVILWLTASCHGFEKQAKLNYLLSVGADTNETPNWLEKLRNVLWVKGMTFLERILMKQTADAKFVKKCPKFVAEDLVFQRVPKTRDWSANLHKRFENRRKKHLQLFILLDTSNRYMSVYMPVLVAVGIGYCVVGNYVCLTMYAREDLRIIFFGGIFLVILMHGLIIFLSQHGAQPVDYFEQTINYWKGEKLGKLQRKQVNAMFAVGFSFAGYMKISKSTAIDLLDDIMNHPVTVLLG